MDKYDILNVFNNPIYWEYEHITIGTLRLNSSSKLDEYSLYSLLIHSIDESCRKSTLELNYINTITFKDIGIGEVEIRFYTDDTELVCIFTLYLETLNEEQLCVDLVGDNEVLYSQTLLEREEIQPESKSEDSNVGGR